MVQTTLRIPKELYLSIKCTAKRRGMTFNAYIISILWDVFE